MAEEQSLYEILDKADDGQEDCEAVYLTITAGDARYLCSLIKAQDHLRLAREVVKLVYTRRTADFTMAEWKQIEEAYRSATGSMEDTGSPKP